MPDFVSCTVGRSAENARFRVVYGFAGLNECQILCCVWLGGLERMLDFVLCIIGRIAENTRCCVEYVWAGYRVCQILFCVGRSADNARFFAMLMQSLKFLGFSLMFQGQINAALSDIRFKKKLV